jgi:hypothetical protein
MGQPTADNSRSPFAVAVRVLVLLLLASLLSYIGYLAIVLGPDVTSLRASDWLRGYERILQPAERRGAVLRTQDGGDRLYFLTTQAERIVPLWIGRRSPVSQPRHLLHVDLWALDAATAQPVWRRRLRTFEDAGVLDFQLLGADNGVLWLFVRQPIGVAMGDGAIVADGAAIERANPAMAGKRVDEAGYVAFGGQGLQLTLDDATQWLIDGRTLAARPRDATPAPAGIAGAAHEASYSSAFQLRGLPIGGTRWLGVLTDEEAARLRGDAVVPGATPGERRGAAADFFARFHAPDRLTVQPRGYRLWGAHVASVSAAPPDWPKELPDNWGKRDQFSDYQPLPDAPSFLQAGLLGDGRSEQAFWFRAPDSVLVLHHDKLGSAGRLRLARIAGPGGRTVWDAAPTLANLEAVAYGERSVILVGTEPNDAHDPRQERSRAAHEKFVSVDIASGAVSVFDLTAESVREDDAQALELERPRSDQPEFAPRP